MPIEFRAATNNYYISSIYQYIVTNDKSSGQIILSFFSNVPVGSCNCVNNDNKHKKDDFFNEQCIFHFTLLLLGLFIANQRAQ